MLDLASVLRKDENLIYVRNICCDSKGIHEIALLNANLKHLCICAGNAATGQSLEDINS